MASNRRLSYLNTFFEWLIDIGAIERNPLKNVCKRKDQNKKKCARRKPLEENEIVKFLEAIKNDTIEITICHKVAKGLALALRLLKLKRKTIIRKAISFFLLVVFAISAAPKTYFHDAFANHKDNGEACTDHSKTAHLHQNGTNCHFDQLVVSTPYHFSPTQLPDVNICFHPFYHERIETPYQSVPFHSSESRGPPSIS